MSVYVRKESGKGYTKRMSVIVPAILPTSRDDLEDRLRRLRGLTNRVQIDIVDGRFAAPATWPYARDLAAFKDEVRNGGLLPHADEFRFEIDLMVSDPLVASELFIAAGASAVTLHVESGVQVAHALDTIRRSYGHDKGFAPGLLSVGLAISIATDSNVLDQYLDRVDYVQFMGIARIGHQGEPFDPRVVRKLRAFREKHPDVPVHVDGGVSLTTAPELITAGVGHLIIGSGLWKARDMAEELRAFTALSEEYGLYH